jgi:glycerate 2-kinase
VRALASPTSLKGILSAREAASALAEGLRAGGAEAWECPVADGGEGTLEVLSAAVGGEWREALVSDPLGREVRARWLLLFDRVAAVESAEAIGLGLVAEEDRDVMGASSRGLGELIRAALAAGPAELIVFLGGTATVDGGAGLLEVVDSIPIPVSAACDVRAPLLDAVRVFARQKGATPEQLGQLERRLENPTLEPYRELPGAGAAGGLGAALVLDLIRLRDRLREADLVVTGEGTIDRSTFMGKAPAAVLAACREAGVRCVLFGGRVVEWREGDEVYELSGEPERAREDLAELGRRLAR